MFKKTKMVVAVSLLVQSVSNLILAVTLSGNEKKRDLSRIYFLIGLIGSAISAYILWQQYITEMFIRLQKKTRELIDAKANATSSSVVEEVVVDEEPSEKIEIPVDESSEEEFLNF